jgi:hypothetical protein
VTAVSFSVVAQPDSDGVLVIEVPARVMAAEAKRPETRVARIGKVVKSLRSQ